MSDFKNKSLLLEDFSYWANKKRYLQLMENFVNGQIDGHQFDNEFCQMWRADRDRDYSSKKSFEKINNAELTKSEGFSDIMSDLFTDCDLFEADPLLRKDYEISEKELKNCVEKALLKIKNRYP